jgi:hypothetical protein
MSHWTSLREAKPTRAPVGSRPREPEAGRGAGPGERGHLAGWRVHVEGRPLTRGWDDAASGQKRHRTEVVAERMVLLDSRGDRAGAGDQAAVEADVTEGEAVAAPF